MDKRVQTIYDRLQSREYRSLRSGKEYSFAQEYAAAGTDPALRAAGRLMKMAQAERAVLFAEDRIGMMRTVKKVPPIFTDEEFAAIAAEHFIFDGAQVNNISSDYASALDGGMEKKRNRILELRAKEQEGSKKYVLYTAMLTSIDALYLIAEKYRAEAERMGNERLAEALSNVPENTPRGYYEALVMLRLLNYTLWLNANKHNTLGRFDVYMFPFYEKDIKSGALAREEALSLTQEFFIDLNFDADLYPGVQQGDNGQSMVLGGCDADGRLCLFPARFELEPSDYAAVGSHTVGGYVLYGENYGLSFEAELTVKDGAKVDGSLGDAVWQDATVHEIALTADGTGLPPYYPAEAAFMVYAGEDGLYFAFVVKDAKLATNYNLTTAADWNLWQNDGIEVYIDASGGAAASLTEDSLTVRCTASDLLRVYAPNAAYSGWSVTNLYNSQAERVQGIRRELCIDGTPNRAYDADEGYTFELFVPYSVFGTDEISDYRIAAGVPSRANTPGGTETAFGAWPAAEQAAFTGVSPAQWVALADAL